MICLKKHIWGVICYIVTPDGKFRLTTEPMLAWSDCILICRSPLPHPAYAQEVEQLLAPWASSPLAFLAFGCSFPDSVFIDKAVFPWQLLKQVPSAHSFSKLCFVEPQRCGALRWLMLVTTGMALAGLSGD